MKLKQCLHLIKFEQNVHNWYNDS